MAARFCYNHMAGRLGVAFADALVRHGYVTIVHEAVALTEAGARWVHETGLLAAAKPARAPQLRLCLDWTERRFHFAGRLASAILQHLLDAGHVVRGEERSLTVARTGKAWFGKLGVDA